jgi:hypothetical protein
MNSTQPAHQDRIAAHLYCRAVVREVPSRRVVRATAAAGLQEARHA